MLSNQPLADRAQPSKRGGLAGADFAGIAGEPGEGPYVHIWLKVDENVVTQANFETNGCPSSIACASAFCHLAKGRDLDCLRLLTAPELLTFLGGLPEGKECYADLTISSLMNLEKL